MKKKYLSSMLFGFMVFLVVGFTNCVTTSQSTSKPAQTTETTEKKAEQKNAKTSKIKEKTVQVVSQESVNLSNTEVAWLPGQVQDKFKSNLQEYLGMRTMVDSKSEAALKKVQAESEGNARDEETAIELGKISTAKFALFVKIRNTGRGYIISADYTDLTTGEQLASVTSKEYSKSEYLYGSTGAVDELTLSLANKLGIPISTLNQNLLTSGSASFSVDEQLALAKQNEQQYKKLMEQYDSELAKLMVSNDLSAIENKKKIEAEKALLAEKQNAEKKRQEELNAQKARAEADAKLEAERSIALKTQRDQMAADAAAKAAEVRKLTMEKQGILGQINVIESKKKALVEIRQSVEERCKELYDQLEKDRASEEQKIRNKAYSTVELGSDGKPTPQALQRRENQITKSYQNLTNKFFADCESVKQSTASQDKALLAEIREDQKALEKTRTVSSLGDELKVSFGTYEGSRNGWNTYLSLYSDGVLLYTRSFITSYGNLAGRNAPNMETELDDSVIEEYTNNVDMYTTLLTRGDPIIYFELDYTVKAEPDNKPSVYTFSFNKIRVINTISGQTVGSLSSVQTLQRTIKPEQDLQEIVGVVAKERSDFEVLNAYFSSGIHLAKAKKYAPIYKEFSKYVTMVKIPGTNMEMMNVPVTVKLYEWLMGDVQDTPWGVFYNGKKDSAITLYWEIAVKFCNKLSEKLGFEPVYSIEGITDVTKWPSEYYFNDVVIEKNGAAGFRLPTETEYEYAAKGEKNNMKAAEIWSKIYDLAPVAQRNPNTYGLYDMAGYYWQWCWDMYADDPRTRIIRSGELSSYMYSIEIRGTEPIAFRLVRTVSE